MISFTRKNQGCGQLGILRPLGSVVFVVILCFWLVVAVTAPGVDQIYIRLQTVPAEYNPSDLNTKKLSRARRDLLMSIVGMTDDRELLKFVPRMPKLN